MDFNYILNKRRSVRKFQENRRVEKKQILDMIATAQKAPSWKDAKKKSDRRCCIFQIAPYFE